jgi:hypothetical protein
LAVVEAMEVFVTGKMLETEAVSVVDHQPVPWLNLA